MNINTVFIVISCVALILLWVFAKPLMARLDRLVSNPHTITRAQTILMKDKLRRFFVIGDVPRDSIQRYNEEVMKILKEASGIPETTFLWQRGENSFQIRKSLPPIPSDEKELAEIIAAINKVMEEYEKRLRHPRR